MANQVEKGNALQDYLAEDRARRLKVPSVPVKDVLAEALTIMSSDALKDASADLNTLANLLPDNEILKQALVTAVGVFNNVPNQLRGRIDQLGR